MILCVDKPRQPYEKKKPWGWGICNIEVFEKPSTPTGLHIRDYKMYPSYSQ